MKTRTRRVGRFFRIPWEQLETLLRNVEALDTDETLEHFTIDAMGTATVFLKGGKHPGSRYRLKGMAPGMCLVKKPKPRKK